MRSTRCRRLFAVLFASLLPRCFVFPAKIVEASLEEVGGPSLEVELFSLAPEGRLRLRYDSVQGENNCLKYTGGKARLNGVELEQTEEGFGVIVVSPIGTGQVCTDPEWAFSAPPATEEVSEFEITDSTGQLLYGVTAMAAKRSLALQPGRPAITPGGPLTLAWSPPTDQLTVEQVTMGIDRLAPPNVSARNGRIGFLVPIDVEPGVQDVRLSVSVKPGTAHCEPDPDGCTTLYVPGPLLSGSGTVTVVVQ